MSHAFLDLIPADRRAPDSPRELMRQRRLARAYRTADNHQSRQRCHLTGIANITQPCGQPTVQTAETSGHQRSVRSGG
jgi:hypothetical protein